MVRFVPALTEFSAIWGLVAAMALGADVKWEAPDAVPQFDVAEFTVRVDKPPWKNSFTEVELVGEFSIGDGPVVHVTGFCDSADGSAWRLRFCPERADVRYHWKLRLAGGAVTQEHSGELRCEPSDRPGPVVVDPDHPKHFVHAGSRQPFYHLGYTAYHLLDVSNDEAQVDRTIDYCAEHGFNKIRFLLTGYPRDNDTRQAADLAGEFGVVDPKRAPNYGAPPGQINALPAWPGQPHAYDFTRFHIPHWQRVDQAVRRMRERGIVATAIFTIEKQDLPAELGPMSDAEQRLYRYAIARLAAFDNVWWDLGNEHNEYRDRAWGDAMGTLVKAADPFRRLASAHAYAEFFYGNSPWADFIITQQYGEEDAVYAWVGRYADVPKPYVNEEYGYEGDRDEPGHNQNAARTRRAHWSIALAGGYATYGDAKGGVPYYYMGEAGPGETAKQLVHLRTLFESLPYRELAPCEGIVEGGFCLAQKGKLYLAYLPRGGAARLDLSAAASEQLTSRWFDPRTGQWSAGPEMTRGPVTVKPPSTDDWALITTAVD